MNAYHVVFATSLQAATAMDTAALAAGAASETLALMRTASAQAGDVVAPEPGYELDLETFTARRLKYFDRPDGSQLRTREDLDPAEVAHAYREAGLSLRECADRFTTSASAINDALQRDLSRPDRWEPTAAADPAETREPPGRRTVAGPVADALKEMGVRNPAAYVRAAAIDMAALDLIDQTLEAEKGQKSSPQRRQRTAAQLAALDGAGVSAPLGSRPSLPEDRSVPKPRGVRDLRYARGRRS
jgi:hypothetical protein